MKISTIILDWAGTTVDYGSFAPVAAFVSAFEYFGIAPTQEETRAPMGLQKRAHIAEMLDGNRLSALWREKYGGAYTQEDIDAIYKRFEPALFETLAQHTEPLPDALDAVRRVREAGIAIGSTTGYTRAMMDVVIPAAKARGYEPDCVVCPDEVGGIGRPYPYMLWRNLEKLGAGSISEALKIGDTAADMQEAVRAGCLCAGVLKGSSMVGLSESELAALGAAETETVFANARRRYALAGADYIIEDIAELPSLISAISQDEGEKYHV